MRKVLNRIALGLIVLLFFSAHASALNYRIDQPKIRLNMPPGWSDGGIIKVENRDSEPLKVRAYLSDWEYSEQDGSKNFLPPGTTSRSCAEWIKFYPSDFTISPGGTQKVNYVVGIPKDGVGGHYAVLFFEVELGYARDEEQQIDVKLYNRIASLFYIEPEGTIIKEAKLENFTISESEGKVNLEVEFLNVGNVDITATGSFDIIAEDGFVLTRGKVRDIYTFPGERAKLYAKGLSAGFSKGKYSVIITLDLEGDLLVGEWEISVSDAGEIVKIKRIE